MNKLKNINNIDLNNKKQSKWNKLPYIFLIAASLLIKNPTHAQSNNNVNSNKRTIEMFDNSNVISNITKKTGIEIPEIYKNEFEKFFSSNKNMNVPELLLFTENFIIEQISKNPGINDVNRAIFVIDCVYEKNTGKNVYEGEDGNEERLNDFEKVIDIIEKIGNDYVIRINEYVQELSTLYEEQSAEAHQQSAEARQQSAEARQQSAEILTSSLENLARFYNRYKKNPSTIRDDEVNQRKEKGKQVIQRCKDGNIDYKSILSPEMLKFYGEN